MPGTVRPRRECWRDGVWCLETAGIASGSAQVGTIQRAACFNIFQKRGIPLGYGHRVFPVSTCAVRRLPEAKQS
jgi:hypothetical protein